MWKLHMGREMYFTVMQLASRIQFSHSLLPDLWSASHVSNLHTDSKRVNFRLWGNFFSPYSSAQENHLDFNLKAVTGSLTCVPLADLTGGDAAVCWSRTGQEGIHLACVCISLGSAIRGLCCARFLSESNKRAEWSSSSSSSRPVEEVRGAHHQPYSD